MSKKIDTLNSQTDSNLDRETSKPSYSLDDSNLNLPKSDLDPRKVKDDASNLVQQRNDRLEQERIKEQDLEEDEAKTKKEAKYLKYKTAISRITIAFGVVSTIAMLIPIVVASPIVAAVIAGSVLAIPTIPAIGSGIYSLIKGRPLWDGVKSFKNKFSTVFKGVAKTLTSPLAMRIINIGCAAATIGGLLTVAAPALLPLVGGVTIGLVAVGTVASIFKTRRLRLLTEENNLLVKYNNSLSKIDYLATKIDPRLSQLFPQKPTATSEDIGSKYYTDPISDKTKFVIHHLTDNIVAGIDTTSQILTAVISLNPINLVRAVASGTATVSGFFSSGLEEKEASLLDTALKININKQRSLTDAPIYKNIEELEAAVLSKQIEQVALIKLMKDPDYFKINTREMAERFERYKIEIDREHNSVADKKQRSSYIQGLLKDVVNDHNPFYKQPDKMTAPSPLAAAIQRERVRGESPQPRFPHASAIHATRSHKNSITR